MALLRLTEITAAVTVIASANYCNGATNLGQLEPRHQLVGTLYLTYSWNCMLYIKLSIPISTFWVLLEANLGITSVSLMGCFTIRVHHLSHFWWKMKWFLIPQHAFFCVMNKPYIDYIKLLTYRHNLSWIQLKYKYFVYGLPLTNFRRGQFLTELRLALFKHMLLKHLYSLGKFIVANE